MEQENLSESTGQSAEHFIPVCQSEILKHLLDEGRLSGENRENFRRFFNILKSMFHFEFLSGLDRLKENYHSFDPDPSTPPPKLGPEEKERAIKEFEQSLNWLMERANFVTLSEEELNKALREKSPLAVNVEVDLNEYSLLRLFTRGRKRLLERMPFLFLFHRKVEIEVYDRLVLEARFSENRKKKKKTTLGMQIFPDKIYLKYFRNVPVKDIEMIFPDPRIQMRTIDKIKVLAPLLTGIGISYVKIGNLAGGSMNLYYTTTVVGLLFAYVFRSIASFINTKNKYIKTLTQGLYFKNLDNNSGVFHAVMGEAEEEEVKEAVLGYYFLLTFGEMTQDMLDRTVEAWFGQRLGLQIDFEVDDALNKLKRLGLAKMTDNGKWRVLPLKAALERIDYLWDNIFDYNQPGGGSSEGKTEREEGTASGEKKVSGEETEGEEAVEADFGFVDGETNPPNVKTMDQL